MALSDAYKKIIIDILISRELGFDRKIDDSLAAEISEELMNNDDFVIQLEQVVSDEIGSAMENIADEFELYNKEDPQ